MTSVMTLKRFYILFLSVVFCSLPLRANIVTSDVEANMRIKIPLALTITNGLIFPKIMAGTLTTVSSQDVGIAGSAGSNASCRVTGEPNTVYYVSGVDRMSLRNSDGETVAVTLSFSGGTSERQVGAGGDDTFYIQGIADVGSKPRGVYTGTQGITVNYS